MHLLCRIVVPPVIRIAQQHYTVIVNNPVQMTCEATGSPTSDIAWTRDGQPLTGNATEGAYLVSNGALRIDRVRMEDAGRYECVASNVAGQATQLVTLSVHGKDTITLAQKVAFWSLNLGQYGISCVSCVTFMVSEMWNIVLRSDFIRHCSLMIFVKSGHSFQQRIILTSPIVAVIY